MKDITGIKYGKLTVVKPIGKNKENRVLWLAICDCGNETKAYKNQLDSKARTHCGCESKNGIAQKTHGFRYHPLYSVWSSMIRRCESTSDKNYRHYGGRGIKVCERWRGSPDLFFSDMGIRPKGASIDRIDTNGNYEPNNCRWATSKQQARNKRNTVFIEYGGEKKSIAEWADQKGVKHQTMYMRYRRGYTNEEIIDGK